MKAAFTTLSIVAVVCYTTINADRTITIDNTTGSAVYGSLHKSNGAVIRPTINGITLDRDGFQIQNSINVTVPTQAAAITLRAHFNDQPSIDIPIAPDDKRITLSYDARWQLTYTNSK